MSIFPPKTIKEVHDALDVVELLRLIDYRTDTIQEIGTTVKCFCPIHKEHVFRTLILEKQQKTYRCSYSLCPGNKGGDLIDLYALVRGMDYDDALQALVSFFHLPVELPATEEMIHRTVEEGDNFLYLVSADSSRSEMYLEEALKRFQRVLSVAPNHPKALRGMYEICRLKGDTAKITELSLQRIRVESESGRPEEVVNLCSNHLEMDPDNAEVRRRLAQALIALERPDAALAELMTLADLCEVREDYAGAIEAYRWIQKLDVGELDVHPMIVNLLVASGRTEEAVEENVRAAEWTAQSGRMEEAIELLRAAVELDPTRDDLRARLVEFSLQLGLDSQRMQEALSLVDDMIARESFDAAGAILLSLCETDPQNPQLFDKLLVIRKRQGRMEEALTLQYRLADLYRDQEDYASALLLLEEILSGQPENLDTLERIAEIHRLEGDPRQAASVYRQIADLATRADDLQRAILAGERMCELEPDAAEHHELVVDLYELAGQTDRALDRLLDLLDALERRGDRERMAAQLERALQLAPDRVDLSLRRAECLEALGRLDDALALRMQIARRLLDGLAIADAIEQLRLVLERQPEEIEALSLLADAETRAGRPEPARALLQKLAEIHIRKERYEDARDTLERLLLIAPEDIPALERLADVFTGLADEEQVIATWERLITAHCARRQFEEALRHIQAILDLRPEHIDTWRRRATLLEQLGRREEALEAFFSLAALFQKRRMAEEERDLLHAILDRDPHNLRALARIATLTLATGDLPAAFDEIDRYINAARRARRLDEALDFLGELQREHPEEIAFHTRRLQLLKESGRREAVADQLKKLATLHLARRNPAEAASLLREALEIEPRDTEWRARLVEVLLSLGETRDAIAESLKISEEYERQNRLEDAERVVLEALKLDEAGEDAHRRLIALARRREQPAQAIEWSLKLADLQISNQAAREAISTLREILEMDSRHLDARRRIVQLYTQLGEVDEAVAQLREIVALQREEGQFEAAVETQREAIALSPNHLALRRELIALFQERSDTARAIGELFELAQFQARLEQHEDALATLEEILGIEPDNLRAMKSRSEIYLAQGNEKQALAELLALSAKLENPALLQAMAGRREPEPAESLPLVEEYTFETFIVGNTNNFAYATALATAKAPARHYNPLFLYSDVGLGKTHLMHAIAHFVLEHDPRARILYTTSEEFTSRLIDAIQNNTINAFRRAYRGVDLLLLDDVQFLAGKERAQEEFFHIFNTLFQAKKQIVLTSDRPPKDIAHLEKRLRSRFGAGVVVDIQAPDFETRTAIVRRALEARPEIHVSAEIINLIARRMDSNVRLLKAAVTQILAQHDIAGEDVSMDMVSRVLDRIG